MDLVCNLLYVWLGFFLGLSFMCILMISRREDED